MSNEFTPCGIAVPCGVFCWVCNCRNAILFEDCVEDSPLRHELTHEKVQAVDGYITPPEGPGLGVTLDEGFVKKYLVAESR